MFVPVAPDVRGRGSWFEGAHSCRGGEARFLEWIAFRGGRAVFCLPLISAEALLLPACPHFSHGLACKEHRPISQPPPVPRRKAPLSLSLASSLCGQHPTTGPQACVQGSSIRPARPRRGRPWGCFV